MKPQCGLLGLLLVSVSAFAGNSVTVYFVPFEIETYIPITAATIKCQASEQWSIYDEREVSSLLKIFKQNAETPFDDRRVRVMFSARNKTFYIDSKGVAKSGKKTYKIDRFEFAAIGKSLKADQRLSVDKHLCNK